MTASLFNWFADCLNHCCSLQKRREKIQNLQTEIDVLGKKEMNQGGLTPGQQLQIQR